MNYEVDEREIILKNLEEFIGTLIKIDVSENDILLIFRNNNYLFLPFRYEYELFCKHNSNNKIGIIYIDGKYKFRLINSSAKNRGDQPVTILQESSKQIENSKGKYEQTRKEVDEFINSTYKKFI